MTVAFKFPRLQLKDYFSSLELITDVIIMNIMLVTEILLILDTNIYFLQTKTAFFSQTENKQHSNKVKIKAGTGISCNHRITEFFLLEQIFKYNFVPKSLAMGKTTFH